MVVENPPAFPSRRDEQMLGGGSYRADRPGMSLRDYFAGQALSGFLADSGHRGVDKECRSEPEFLDLGPSARMAVVNREVAGACYSIADAMLAARRGEPA